MHEIYSTWAWGTAIVVGFFLVVSFLINAKIGLLLYLLIMPALQPLMEVAVAIPGSAATVALGGVLQAIILIVALWQVARLNVRSLKVPVVLIFMIFWLIMGISMVESPDKIRAIKEWGRIGSLVFIYVLAGLSFKGEKDVRQFVKVLLLSLIIPLGLAGYQLITNTGYVSQLEGVHRIMGTFGNPVVFALYLTFPLLLCITMFMDRKMRYEGRFFFGFGVLLFACSLFLTYTRSSWFGLMAGIMVIGLKRSKGLLVGAALLALLVLLVVPLESIRLGEFTTGRLSFSGRIAGWKMMLPLVKDYPIFGHGLTSFGDVTTQSDHVRLLLETGFLGWIVFLCLILVLLKALLKTYRSLQPGIEKNFVLAYLAFFVCTIVISFSETNALLQYYVWIPAGIVLAKSIRGSVKIVDAAGAPQGSKGSSSLGAPGLYPRYSYKAGR